MKNWKASLVEFLSAIGLALFLLALAPNVHGAGDMPPPEQRPSPPVVIQPQHDFFVPLNCSNGICVVPERVMLAMGRANAELAQENDGLRDQLGRAAKGKKCAVLEVLPPTKGGRS